MKEITMNLLYLVNDGQVMLALKKRGHGAGRHNGVGGKLNPGESVEQSLIREAQEEIGVTPQEFEKMAYITFDLYMKGEHVFEHVHIYTTSNWTSEPVESEEVSPRWFDIGNLPFDTMWPNDIHFLPHVLGGKKVKGQFKLDKDDQVLFHDVKIVKKL